MPSTVNGIGTHYYGKKNLQKRVGTCHSCGRQAELKSYDTRLWFVIFFIPIIPLGRKRILDDCSVCRRHYMAEADKWETAKQLEISGAQEKFRSEPTPDNAIAVYQQLLHFHQIDEAAEFQKTMAAKFPDNAKVQAFLGAAMTHLGKLSEAEPYFERALALRPDLPEARVGVAMAHIRAGRLDEARKLLDHLEQPGASKLYSFEPLDSLARAYQNANRHDDALAIFTIIQQELPKVAEEDWFRKLVAKSEKDTGRQESQLPKRKFSWKRFLGTNNAQTTQAPQFTFRTLLIIGVILGLVGIGMAISNEYIRRHRTLHVLSVLREPVLVQVQGQSPVRVSRGVTEIKLPEGKYHVVVSGPIQQEVDFEIRSGYWGRWFDDAVWVLNVGGLGILQRIDAVYRSEPEPATHSFYFGESFVTMMGITHAFRELPEKAKSGTRFARLDVFSDEVMALFYYFLKQGNAQEALRLGETRLRQQPDDAEMVPVYAHIAREQGQIDRAERFLQTGLTNRPVLVQWHRVYQSLRNDRARDAQLAADYSKQLEAEPTNSALMYLRGRVAMSREESRQWFQRAAETDTNNAYAFFALGYDEMSHAEWAKARVCIARAAQLRPEQDDFSHHFALVRLALGEYSELEKELRERIARHPLDYAAARRLCDVLVGQKRAADATEFVRTFQIAAARASSQVGEANRALRRHLLYVTEDFATLEKESAQDNSPEGQYSRFIALIELGRTEDAIKLLPLDSKGNTDPFHILDTAIALKLAGNALESSRWLTRALQLLEQGTDDMIRAAAVLRKSTPPTTMELDNIALVPEAKAAVVAALAQLHPARHAELSALALKLNVSPGYPQHLIATAMAAKQ